MTTQVSLDIVAAAKGKLDAGDLAGAWRVLADAGDVYARATARVTDASQPTVMRHLVESFWDVAVGGTPGTPGTLYLIDLLS
jgi:hypothetical protein